MTDLITSIDTTTYKIDDLGDIKPVLVLGGTTEKFVPNINMSFMCGSGAEKFFINLNRKSVVVTDQKETLANDELKLVTGDETDIFHVSPDGTFVWDIEFAKKPLTNVFTWELSYSSGLKFCYQGELTQQEIDEGCSRPDNVVGSYAVYCNKRNHIKRADGSTIVNYRNGKLCHIYRPLCIDADKKTVWADLHVGYSLDVWGMVLTITIPQKFLDTAKYPIVLDPDVGYTSPGGSNSGTDNTGVCQVKDGDGNLYAVGGTAGTLDSVSVYLAVEGVNDWNKNIDAGVYNKAVGDAPDDLLDNATLTSGWTTGDWNEITLPDSVAVSASTPYFPAVAYATGTGNTKYDSDAQALVVYSTSSPTLPNPNDWSSTVGRLWSVFFSYTESVGGGVKKAGAMYHYMNH